MKKTILIIACATILITLAIFPSPSTVKAANDPHGAISITFDDSTKNQFSYAYQLMQARGMVATYYAISNQIDQDGFLTHTDLQTLQANGNEIGSHSQSHPHLTQLSNSSKIQEIYGSKQTLESYGLTVNNFAYPYGETNDTVDYFVSQYYRSGRQIMNNLVLWHFPVPNYTNFTNFYNVPGYASETGDSSVLPRLKSAVDNIYSQNGWGVFAFHNVLPGVNDTLYTISTENFTAFLDYVANQRYTHNNR